jgi:hypothetical protein
MAVSKRRKPKSPEGSRREKPLLAQDVQDLEQRFLRMAGSDREAIHRVLRTLRDRDVDAYLLAAKDLITTYELAGIETLMVALLSSVDKMIWEVIGALSTNNPWDDRMIPETVRRRMTPSTVGDDALDLWAAWQLPGIDDVMATGEAIQTICKDETRGRLLLAGLSTWYSHAWLHYHEQFPDGGFVLASDT